MNQAYYTPKKFSILPLVVKNLLIINGLFFIATFALQRLQIDLYELFGLHFYQSGSFYPWQLVTHMFMHGNLSHLFFNMFALWMFGYTIENLWGGKRFLIYYFATGIGAALVHYGVIAWQLIPDLRLLDACIQNPTAETVQQLLAAMPHLDQHMVSGYHSFKQNVALLNAGYDSAAIAESINMYLSAYREALVSAPNMVGASGAVYGILLAFGMLFPNARIYIYFLFPVKAKWFVIFYGLIELSSGIFSYGDGIAHFAHLGGMIFGFFLILWWRKKGNLHYMY
jgi:membrane associated rhomboid family serine protease